jgi:hypothetical protein
VHDELSQIFCSRFAEPKQGKLSRLRLTTRKTPTKVRILRIGGAYMVRELQIMTVGLVFLFLGAIVVGVF